VAGPVPSSGPHLGRVTSFDPARGLGAVEEDDGTSFGFHATAIADGSRRIDVGTAVAFTVTPGHRGRYEARALVPVPVAAPG
jgi:cold shock CspA family protein